MTFLLEDEEEIAKILTRRLKRRGLKPSNEEWEVHGPHKDMNYEVFIGACDFIPEEGAKCICPPGSAKANCPIHGFVLVAVYPRAVYEIEDESLWWDVYPEDKIPVNIL